MQNEPKKENPPQDAVKDARKQITRSIILALAALAVIAFACYAWFVSTKDVTGSISPVQLMGSTFELASAGGQGSYDSMLPEDLKVDGETWNNDKSGTVTSTGKASILWQVSDSSNLKNTNDTGIQPGSNGTIQFYVIPKLDGVLNLSFQIELLPMKKEGTNTLSIIENDTTLSGLLKGHFLFQYSTDGTDFNWVSYSTGQFSQQFENCTADTPILVTLKWDWPYLLKLVTKHETVVSWMKEAPNCFFYNEDGSVTAPADLSKSSAQFAEYDRYYNNADEYIGEHAYGVLLRLTAEAV